MGLDIVECIMRIEEEFGVELDDEELSYTRTVGEVFEMVIRRLELAEHGVCLSQSLFHQVRRSMMQQFRLARLEVSLDLSLAPLMPEATRREAWAELEHRLGLALPFLHRPGPIEATSLAVPLAGIAAGWSAGSVVVGLLACVPAGWLWGKATQGTAKVLPVKDVRELCQVLMDRNYRQVTADKQLTRAQVWERLVEVVDERTSVERELVTYDARWVDDLLLD